MAGFSVSRCICHNRTFEEIKYYAERNGYTTVGELQSDQFCSCNCGLCIPYLEWMFRSGETEFRPGVYIKKEGRDG